MTQRPPRYLADDIDGRALFDAATARRRALGEGRTDTGGVASLGDIVAVPPVREAREAGRLKASPMFARIDRDGVAWADGTRAPADAVIWCTGYRPALSHLPPLGLRGTRGCRLRRGAAVRGWSARSLRWGEYVVVAGVGIAPTQVAVQCLGLSRGGCGGGGWGRKHSSTLFFYAYAAVTVSAPVIVESRPSSAEEYRETRRLSVCRPR
ncbi:hypothetical protein GCM10010233_18800 [Streptomyces pseudogriseolus]|uniref:Monooxygenase n=2 Tax=Streptomyces TaxID=1883 RepID=A0ABU0KB93_9ACTN|nr:monooxygenase [Streptomyces coelicoflavus ZG0656]MDQ0486646.1 hypothetical protein [Streptomyces thermodiastaticus]GGQ02635.1 hypothetical protein GCM10010233_18800 [Streptomyces gancidicus]GHE34596.1 hypothetical protein GCM10018771_13470 [Streptomyces cellulosae]